MRTPSLAFVLVAALAGCSASTSTRTVTGQLRTSNPNTVVTAQSMNQQLYTSGITSTGQFALQLPTGASYALNVGSAQIDWPTSTGPARWARLGDGATLDLGHVSKQSSGHYACDHHASSDDHCDREDNDDGGDDDHGDDDGDHGGSYGGSGGYGGGHACDGGTHSGGGGSGGGGGGGAGGAGGGGGGGGAGVP